MDLTWTFHALAVVNRPAMNIRVHLSFWIMVFSGYTPRSGIAESYGYSSYLKNNLKIYPDHHLFISSWCLCSYMPLFAIKLFIGFISCFFMSLFEWCVQHLSPNKINIPGKEGESVFCIANIECSPLCPNA